MSFDMDWMEIVGNAINLATALIDRAKQSGELTEEQEAEIDAQAAAAFSRFSTAPPPPEGAT